MEVNTGGLQGSFFHMNLNQLALFAVSRSGHRGETVTSLAVVMTEVLSIYWLLTKREVKVAFV